MDEECIYKIIYFFFLSTGILRAVIHANVQQYDSFMNREMMWICTLGK